MGTCYKEKYLGLVKRILVRPVFYHVFFLSLFRREVPDKQAVIQVLKEFRPELSDSTLIRRSATVRGWIAWIWKLAKDG